MIKLKQFVLINFPPYIVYSTKSHQKKFFETKLARKMWAFLIYTYYDKTL